MVKLIITLLAINCAICNSETICLSNGELEKVKKLVVLYPLVKEKTEIQQVIISNQELVISNYAEQCRILNLALTNTKKECQGKNTEILLYRLSFIPVGVLLIILALK